MERFYETLYFLVVAHPDYPQWAFDYLDFIFPHVFIVGILIVPTLVAAVYYNLINNLTGRLGYLIYWFIFMGIAGVLGFVIAITRAANVIYYGGVEIGPEVWILAIMNAVYAMLFYFIISLFLKAKKLTIYADFIPFITRW
jgi:hypothetical protein